MKAYNKPTMTVVELKLKNHILIGSEITDINTNLGNDDFELGGGSSSSAQAPEITDFMGEEF